MDALIIKIGGSVITDKTKEFSLRKEILDQVAEELASVREKLVLVHGGGSFGHPMASKYDISSGYHSEEQLLGFSMTHQAMEKLNSKVVKALTEAGRPATPIQTSACATVENDQLISVNLQNLRKFLDLNIVPVLYGDCVPDLKKGMTVLSGDQLVAYLAQELEVDRVILGVDTDGIHTGDPKMDENAELIPKLTPDKWEKISSSVDFSSESDVTGGMENKVKVLLELAKKDIESVVINATKPEILKRAIRTDIGVGTRVCGDD